MASLKPVRFKSRALALLARGLSIDEVAAELHRRYHPVSSMEKVKRAYFPPKGTYAISRLEGGSREEILEKLRIMTRHRQILRQFNRNPKFAAIRKANILLLNQPAFVEARVETSRRTMRLLNSNPAFVERHKKSSRKTLLRRNRVTAFAEQRDTRIRLLHKDPVFIAELRRGLERFWRRRRLEKAGLRTDIGFEGGKPVPVVNDVEDAILRASEHDLIVAALRKLNPLERAVVAEEFDLEIPKAVAADTRRLTDEEKLAMLEAALSKLRGDKSLRELAD